MKRTAELWDELKAIRLWDRLYAESDYPDEIDMAAWSARREREAQICCELKRLSRLSN
jgi:hypothetical protein